MDYEKKVSSILNKNRDFIVKKNRLNRLNENYKALEKRGVVVKPKYSLPPKDTIGMYFKKQFQNRKKDTAHQNALTFSLR